MQQRAAVLTLLAAALACSGEETTPTDTRPEFAGGCLPITITTGAAWKTAPQSSTAQVATFTVKNNCASASGSWDLSAVGSSAVFPSFLTPSPAVINVAAGKSVTVTVPFNTNTKCWGSVVLTARQDQPTPPALRVSATQDVAVRGVPGMAPFGPFDLFTSASGTQSQGVQSFNLSLDPITAADIITRINAASNKCLRLLTAMTGGKHDQYMSRGADDILRFDMTLWKQKMDTYRDPNIQTAVANAVADRIVIGNSVMDEPHVFSTDPEGGGNTWGPEGTMTKARVDTMCSYVKGIFPGLPVGVVHRHDRFEPTKDYAVCEFIVDQYVTNAGTVTAFRDAGLGFANRSGIKVAFSMNIVNGGTQDRVAPWDCPGSMKGDQSPFCRMTASDIRSYGQVLGPAGCAMFLWKYENTSNYMVNNQAAFSDVASLLKTKPMKSCAR